MLPQDQSIKSLLHKHKDLQDLWGKPGVAGFPSKRRMSSSETEQGLIRDAHLSGGQAETTEHWLDR